MLFDRQVTLKITSRKGILTKGEGEGQCPVFSCSLLSNLKVASVKFLDKEFNLNLSVKDLTRCTRLKFGIYLLELDLTPYELSIINLPSEYFWKDDLR